ncbi:YihY/virulence factor BrkB family protein [Pedosphaera parvula]|uniref:Ribonuclease BN n=1 Tax=Pedosphaera parvula (strain Ellin514) TaxID=320771 RepID=B9XHA9_PEDPL|nr:YihY/virulence factor BrkB family protein [Pedosphaera parvula]EEF60744.1 ribonuclease BN [Pedosphaera parvula Ellin514]
MASTLKAVWGLLKQSVNNFINDNAQRLGAALSYYTVLALPPLFVILFFVAGLVLRHHDVQKDVFNQVGGLIGKQGGEAIKSIMANPQQQQKGFVASAIAIGALLVTSTGLFLELQNALNSIWGVREKPGQGVTGFIKNRLLSFGMIVIIGFLLLVSMVVSTALTALNKYFAGLVPDLHILWQILNVVVSFGVITVLFAMLFKVLPDVKIAWKDVWIGAAITAFLFTLGKFGLGLYLGKSATASAYGAAGSLVIILLWVYYSAQILFFGAEVTQAYACRFGEKMEPVAHAEWIEQGNQKDKTAGAAPHKAEAEEEPEHPQVNRVEKQKQIVKNISRRVDSWHDLQK